MSISTSEYSKDFSSQYNYPAYLKYVASNHSLSDQKVLRVQINLERNKILVPTVKVFKKHKP